MSDEELPPLEEASSSSGASEDEFALPGLSDASGGEEGEDVHGFPFLPLPPPLQLDAIEEEEESDEGEEDDVMEWDEDAVGGMAGDFDVVAELFEHFAQLFNAEEGQQQQQQPPHMEDGALDLSARGLVAAPQPVPFLGAVLQSLNLGKNHLSDLPQEFSLLRRLHSLFLDENTFRQVPECLRNLVNLRELDLSSNSISDIPEWFSELPKLTVLYGATKLFHACRLNSLNTTFFGPHPQSKTTT